MDDKSLLELCASISGAFENGKPAYDAITGNFDGMGLSAGLLQWCAGQGSLQTLLQTIAAKHGPDGWTWMQTFFVSDIHHFAILKPQEAIQWCRDHFIKEGSTDVDPEAARRWKTLLATPESIQAQLDLAENGVLHRAKILAAQFVPDNPNSTRVLAFFFDLVTQSGGMQNKVGRVDPLPAGSDPDVSSVLDFAHQNNPKCAGMWELATQNDRLSRLLLYYAYKRSQLSKAQYVWDACSRRGSIACRVGVVHGAKLNFTSLLD